MKYLSKAIPLLVLCLPSMAKVPNLDFDMSIYGFNVDSKKVIALKGGMRVGIQASGKVNELVSYTGDMNIFFEQGSHTAALNDSYQNATTYGINKALIKLSPTSFLDASFGVSKIDKQYAPLFINTPTLGAIQKLKVLDFESIKWSLEANQMVVTTNTVQNSAAQIQDDSPYFLSFGSKLELKKNNLSSYLALNTFSFNSLTAKNARISSYRGSTTTGIDDGTKFNEDYDGFDASGAISYKASSFEATVYAQYLYNSESNDTANLYGTRLQFNKSYELSVESFTNEADTLPALVVSPYYGGTNRIGKHLGFKYLSDEASFVLHYFNLDVDKANINQADMQIISFDYQIKLN